MRALLVLCLVGFSASLAFAKPGTVRTRDGRNIEGDITETDTEVTIATRVASITFNRTDIAAIIYAASIKEQYEKRLAALPKDAGARSRLDLARWLFENKEYTLARAECDAALKLDPNSADATMLRQTVERAMLWEKTRGANPPANPPTAVAPTTPVAPTPSAVRPGIPKARRLLDLDQINIIRQAELKDGELPRARLDKNVKQRFIQHRNLVPKEFNTVPEPDKAIAILKEGTPDMRPDVKILSDPASLAAYKRLQPMLLMGCASANCHGSTKAGTFMLYNPSDSEASTYTNFYILTQYNPYLAGTVHKSIDRQQPKNSLIAEYGLPRDQAKTPHPDVPGYAPIFRGATDPKYLGVTQWVESLLTIERDYKITFALPGGPPATQPADAPATQPAQPDATTPQPEPNSPTPNPNNQRPGNSGGETNETLKDIRSRLRPIRGL